MGVLSTPLDQVGGARAPLAPPFRRPWDGSEDSSIHCIKQGNPAAEANSIIERCTAALLREDENPFDFDSSDCDESCSDGELSFPSEDEVELYLWEQEFTKPLYCKQFGPTLL